MTEKHHTTQRLELEKLRQAVDHLPRHIPADIKNGVRDALDRVPGVWNAATCDEPFPLVWETQIQSQLYVLARKVLADLALEKTMSPRLESQVYGNLKIVQPQSN